MRKVVKPESDKTAKLSSIDTQNALVEICLSPDNPLISDTIYRDPYDTHEGKRSRV